MIDTHCHIDLYDDPLEVAIAAETLAVKTVAVTYLPSHFVLASKHLASFKHVRPALGLHPLAVKDHAREIRLFEEYFRDAEYIGEVGLDFSGENGTTKSAQEKSFATCIGLLKKSPKFVTLHSRGAEESVLGMLEDGGVGPVVFHWFSGSSRQLKNLLDAGHRISLNPSMIKTAKWGEFISYAPRSAILTETDGPFVKIGKRPATPGDVSLVVSWLSQIWSTPPDAAAQQVESNLRSLMVDLQVHSKKSD